jgi:hypothetical protein
MLIDGLVMALNAIVFFLPDSPFREPIENIQNSLGSELLGYINYFLPVAEMITIIAAWLVCIGLYYLASIIMRWAKAVS